MDHVELIRSRSTRAFKVFRTGFEFRGVGGFLERLWCFRRGLGVLERLRGFRGALGFWRGLGVLMGFGGFGGARGM